MVKATYPVGAYYGSVYFSHSPTNSGFSERLDLTSTTPSAAEALLRTYIDLRLAICPGDIRVTGAVVRDHGQRGVSWPLTTGDAWSGLYTGSGIDSYHPSLGVKVRF